MNALLAGPLVVFDCETTGIYPEKGARVCEIGAVKVEKGKIVADYSSLIDPEISMPPDASAVNGLYDIDLFGASRFRDAAPQFFAFVGDAPLFGYKIGFDMGFLSAECERVGLSMPANAGYDVLGMAKHCLDIPHYKLGQVATYLNIAVERKHRALDDAKTTFAVYEKLVEMLATRGIDDLALLQELCGYGGANAYRKSDVQHALIVETIRAKRTMRIKYCSSSGERSDREIRPLRIEKRGRDFFLVAECVLRNDMRSFNIARIEEFHRV